MKNSRRLGGLIVVSAMAAALAPQSAAADPKMVVELFTSQGCSSCPPANANLIKINKRKDVLTLSFSVTYWDYLGWRDTYGRPEFTERQITYEPRLGQQGPYTPQIVVNGAATGVGSSLREIETLLSEVPALEGPALAMREGLVQVGVGDNSEPADIWLVRYDAQIRTVPIEGGENSDRALPHIHVVHRLERLGTWKGDKVSFRLPRPDAGLKTAVLVQRTNGGPILAAITD